MNVTIRSKVVKIGNSRGVRIPRTLLEQAGLEDDVEMTVEGNRLIIQSPQYPRQGWEEQFLMMTKLGDDHMLDQPIVNRWDEEEWTW